MARTTKTTKTANTQTTKTRKPMQPEQQFKRAFTPLTSKKDGTARLTFAGYVHDMAKNTDKPYFRLVFSAMDITRQNPANIAVLSSYRYSETNLLGRFLNQLGWVAPEDVETVIDEDDEFGYSVETELTSIYDFLESIKGLVFKGDLIKGDNNLYRLEVETLEPLLSKDGKQLTDYDPSEGLSHDQITVDADVQGGDN
ncbi:MAG: hypothetical protein HC874_23620 [Richelia sp. SL_2_1]|nr:hypothetical protein [Richelia sp. SL_2_1]